MDTVHYVTLDNIGIPRYYILNYYVYDAIFFKFYLILCHILTEFVKLKHLKLL